MGINHPHVRFVVHNTMAAAFDRLLQESGRAGRDGEPVRTNRHNACIIVTSITHPKFIIFTTFCP